MNPWTPRTIRTLDDRELARAAAHARNRRDAFAPGRELTEVMRELRVVLDEQARRRAERRAAYVAVEPREHSPECRRGLRPPAVPDFAHFGLDRERCERCRALWARLDEAHARRVAAREGGAR